MLGDGVIELHNLDRGGVDLNLKGWKNLKTNLLKRQSKKGLGADAQLRLTLGYQLNHVWKKPKDLQLGQPKHVSDWLDYSLWRKNIKNLEPFLFFTRKLLAVEKKQA